MVALVRAIACVHAIAAVRVARGGHLKPTGIPVSVAASEKLRGTDGPCADEQANCQELLSSEYYTCDTDLHHVSSDIQAGVTLRTLCCNSCADTPSCANDPVCDSLVGESFGCDDDISPFVRNLTPGTTVASLCPQKCDSRCSIGDEVRTPDTACSNKILECATLVPMLSCSGTFPFDGRSSTIHTLCPEFCDESCDADVSEQLGSSTLHHHADGSDVLTNGSPETCSDDMHWGTEHGDCSTYAPGQTNADYCQRDGADQHCLISCGVCSGGNPACWQESFTFQRCCGGLGGDPGCFDERYTFDACCSDSSQLIASTADASQKTCENCQNNCPDCRIDPADGHTYTKQEFLEQYGGTTEWENALSASEENSSNGFDGLSGNDAGNGDAPTTVGEASSGSDDLYTIEDTSSAGGVLTTAGGTIAKDTEGLVGLQDSGQLQPASTSIFCSELQRAVLTRCVGNCRGCDLTATRVILSECLITAQESATRRMVRACGVPEVSNSPSTQITTTNTSWYRGAIRLNTVLQLGAHQILATGVAATAALALLSACICRRRRRMRSCSAKPNSMYIGQGKHTDAFGGPVAPFVDDEYAKAPKDSSVPEMVINPFRLSRMPSGVLMETV